MPTPFELTAETANKLAGSLALHEALKQLQNSEAPQAEQDLQREILVQALLILSPIVGEA